MNIKFLVAIIAITIFYSCNLPKPDRYKDKVLLSTSTLNKVKLSDTMVIHEGVCRGCAYEQSTHFTFTDTTGVVKMYDVITEDNNPPNMDGGSVEKHILIVPQKAGRTTIKLYRIEMNEPTSRDSANAVAYDIEVVN